MKKIVKGNDFTLRIPVAKMVEGQPQAFPLPACTDVVIQVCNQFKRIPLAFEIDVKEDNVLLARVEGDKVSLGTYAIEVKGKIFGNDWRSNEYPQFAIVSNNADADTEFGTTDEGDNSVEMDTAMVILPPTVELSDLINKANETLKNNKETNGTINTNEEARKEAETLRKTAEQGRVSAEEARVSAEGDRTRAEENRISVEAERVKAEQARVENEITRQTNELTRKGDETKRIAAESERVKVEKARTDAESSRAVAETERVDAEAQRVSAEGERVKAETGRASAEAERVKADKKRQSDTDTAIKRLDDHRTEFDNAEEARVNAESGRVEAEKNRQSDFSAAKTKCEQAAKVANDAATAAVGAEKVNAELDGNVLTVTNRNGEQKSVNLTDTDEHVTVNCTTTMDGVSMEGLVINVYVNNGTDPHQYTTDANGQAEFTIAKGATYKVVFPYVPKCNIIDPVQHIASVGNRIIDANYIAETEKVERLTIRMSKADESGNVTPWEGGKAYVTIAGKRTEYAMDADGKAIVEIKNGTSYTVSVDKIDGMYEQYDRYSITRTAIADSYRFSFVYRPYESGIWLIDDNNKQWSYDDWEASGNDNSKLMFVRIATLATQRYKGDILISIDKMADFSKIAISKQWCNQNVEFKNIPINGLDNNNMNWSRFVYNGLLATQTIIAEGDERGLTTAAADYCYSSTITNGDKLYQGYLPTAYQWELTWQNIDIVIDAINKKYPDLNVNKTAFGGNKWTSTQSNAASSYYFDTAVNGNFKTGSFMAFPFYDCLSDSPSLLSLQDEQDESLAQAV
jgi:hypothetical protein|nr:MAG TPA: MAEBL protein [Caudoviricetes sp.]